MAGVQHIKCKPFMPGREQVIVVSDVAKSFLLEPFYVSGTTILTESVHLTNEMVIARAI